MMMTLVYRRKRNMYPPNGPIQILLNNDKNNDGLRIMTTTMMMVRENGNCVMERSDACRRNMVTYKWRGHYTKWCLHLSLIYGRLLAQETRVKSIALVLAKMGKSL